MKILLDTHVLIWSLTNDFRLAQKARDMILSHENIIYVSAASLWEISIKNLKAPEVCPYHEKEILHFCDLSGYETLSIQPAHILEIRGLRIRDGHHLANQDPFDRMLLSQAKADHMTLLTHDQIFSHYDEPCICLF